MRIESEAQFEIVLREMKQIQDRAKIDGYSLEDSARSNKIAIEMRQYELRINNEVGHVDRY